MFISTLDCAAMSDDKSVLGNLPRSRPGRRSDKRGKTESAGRPAAEAPKPPRAKPRASSERPKAKREPAPAPERDPVTEAARATVKVVGAGVRIGTGIAQEVLRRLPRP
jgi:hypothetical protein